jgi:DNA-binding NarL/FixJ family response regulator
MAGGLLLLGVIGWLMYQRKIQEQLNAKKLLEQENKLARARVDAAMEQLSLFTQSIVDKNELIEQLNLQALENNRAFQPEELLGQTILTDEDWLRFRNMFEKVYPGFFDKLQQMANDVTQSELRMAALIRLSVGNKHIASMLGVSVDTVRKTKSRLRQRLNLAPNADIESFITVL